MNTIERIRNDLRCIQATDYVERIRDQLARSPNDADLRWALAELERTERVLLRSELRLSRQRRRIQMTHPVA